MQPIFLCSAVKYSLCGSFPTPWKTANYRLAVRKQTHRLISRILSSSISAPSLQPQIQQSQVKEKETKIWRDLLADDGGKKNSNSVIFIFFLLWQIHGSHPSSAWTSRIRDKSKFSEPQRQASYDFKRVQFALNVHTDATDDEQGLGVLPIQAIMHYFISAAASGPVCFLYTLSLSIITEARALTLGQFKKLSRLILLQSVLHSKHPLTYNLKRSLFQ